MIRRLRILPILLAEAVTVLAQAADPPLYRVPAEYAYFTATEKPMPAYPPEAFTSKVGGDVILMVEYSTEGNVEAVQRVMGDPVLVKAATDAVTNWKFYPIKEKRQKAKGVTYVGFHYVASTDTVFSSFPFGKWEQAPLAATSTTEAPSKPARVRINSGLTAGHRISGSNPKYPDSAKANHIQGSVQLRAIISREGEIRLLEVVQAPSLDLAISAIEAVKAWRYQPYVLNGEPVEVETVIMVNYTLQRL